MNATGHEITARIAWNSMTPATRQTVARLVEEPSNPTTGIPTSDRDNDVFTYTTYMDHIRPSLNKMHYTNTPLQGDGKQPAGDNSVTFQKTMIKTLSDPSASQADKAEALRLGGHLTGDIHQPLHNADKGDRGGNSFGLNGKKNLHSYWDQAGGAWASSQTPDQLTALVAGLQAKYPMEFFGTSVNEAEPSDWSRQGWQLAKDKVYEGVEPGRAPSQRYAKIASDTMSRQAVLAGYRWARQLNLVFDKKN